MTGRYSDKSIIELMMRRRKRKRMGWFIRIHTPFKFVAKNEDDDDYYYYYSEVATTCNTEHWRSGLVGRRVVSSSIMIT